MYLFILIIIIKLTLTFKIYQYKTGFPAQSRLAEVNEGRWFKVLLMESNTTVMSITYLKVIRKKKQKKKTKKKLKKSILCTS